MFSSKQKQTVPKGWHAEWDDEYNANYYINTLTGGSQWDVPYESATASPEQQANTQRFLKDEGVKGYSADPTVPQERGLKTNLTLSTVGAIGLTQYLKKRNKNKQGMFGRPYATPGGKSGKHQQQANYDAAGYGSNQGNATQHGGYTGTHVGNQSRQHQLGHEGDHNKVEVLPVAHIGKQSNQQQRGNGGNHDKVVVLPVTRD